MASSKGKTTGGKKAEGFISALQQKVKAESIKIVAGLPRNSAPYPDGTSVIEVGHKNEFGSMAERIPERSFLRSTLQENAKKYSAIAKKVGARVLTGKANLEKEAGKIGLVMENDIKDKIVNLKTPPNAARTIREKGSSNPLVDTGHMGQSIRHEVRGAE